MMWQPIESAPRDGTMIVACNANVPMRGYTFIFWDDDGWAGYTADDDKRLVKFAPTHWMPLPELPDASKYAEDGA